MIIIYICISVFIAWIWVDYFRLIDIYDKEKLKYLVLTFLLGVLSTQLVWLVDAYVMSKFGFRLNGEWLNDVLYCFLGVGLVEELAKLVPFILVYRFCKKQFNEPVDYIVFISVSALGFSAAENVLYFNAYGARVIDGRAILSTVGHMFDTSLIAYGIIKAKFYDRKPHHTGIWKFVLLAALSHGFYDFWLMYDAVKPAGWLVTILYFFVTISVFATILNNALNYSSFFTYKKVIDSGQVVKRLLIYYTTVFVFQVVLLATTEGSLYTMRSLRGSFYISGFIVVVSVLRLSRFKLVQNRWETLKFELPFSLSYGGSSGFQLFGFFIKVKGEAFNETFINAYYEEYCYLSPLSRSSPYLVKSRLGFIDRKIFLKNAESFYVAKVYHHNERGTFDTVLLKPKTDRTTMFNEQQPIVAVLKIRDLADLENPEKCLQDFKFREWAIVKPKKEVAKIDPLSLS